MILGKSAIRRHFLPYLCVIHPTAVEVAAKAILENRPHFKKAKVFEPHFLSADNKKNMNTWFAASAKCKKQGKSRNMDSLTDSFEEDRYMEEEHLPETEETDL